MPKGFTLTLEERFNGNRINHPRWSSYTCLANAIVNHKYPEKEIRSDFNKLVDKKDYYLSEKPDIIQYLLTRIWETA